MGIKTPYEGEVRKLVSHFGGFFNAHSHGDRAFTRKNKYYSHVGLSVPEIEKLSLSEKQNLTWVLHTGEAFSEECLRERWGKLLEDSIKYGVSRIDSCVDVTYNTGTRPFEIALNLKKDFKDRIDLRLGAYNPSGFKEGSPERFSIFEEVASNADFLVALAEKDRKEGHIGEQQHNVYMLNKGIELNVPVHFHAGQANKNQDRGTELLFKNIGQVYDLQHRFQEKNYHRNLVIHDISASCYDEEDFERHCENLSKFNLGVICCPTAGISMKQDRNIYSPTHNSLARIWDYMVREIPVFIGTDNINDVFVPSSTPDLYDEVLTLTNSLRGYNERVVAKISSGEELDPFDRGRVNRFFN